MRLVSKGNVICRGHKEVICQCSPCLNMGVGYQGYQVLSPKVWGWVTADLVLLFPCYSLNPTFLPLI